MSREISISNFLNLIIMFDNFKTRSVVKSALPIYYGKLLNFFSGLRETLQTSVKIGRNRTH